MLSCITSFSHLLFLASLNLNLGYKHLTTRNIDPCLVARALARFAAERRLNAVQRPLWDLGHRLLPLVLPDRPPESGFAPPRPQEQYRRRIFAAEAAAEGQLRPAADQARLRGGRG